LARIARALCAAVGRRCQPLAAAVAVSRWSVSRLQGLPPPWPQPVLPRPGRVSPISSDANRGGAGWVWGWRLMRWWWP